MKKFMLWQFAILFFFSVTFVACDDDDDTEPDNTEQDESDENGTDEEENGTDEEEDGTNEEEEENGADEEEDGTEEENGEETSDEEVNAEHLIGTWVQEGEDEYCEEGSYEHQADGTLIMYCPPASGDLAAYETTYSISGKQLTWETPFGTSNLEIVSLSETEMEVIAPDGSTLVYHKQ